MVADKLRLTLSKAVEHARRWVATKIGLFDISPPPANLVDVSISFGFSLLASHFQYLCVSQRHVIRTTQIP